MRARPLFVFLLTALLAPVATSVALAQTAAARYSQAQAREASARAAETPSVTSLRAVAAAYEQIPRRYPRSGYSDNALWQAAGLMQLAYERGRASKDRDKAAQLLTWLAREYPKSPLVKDVPTRLASLRAAAASRAAAGAAARPAPTPTPAPLPAVAAPTMAAAPPASGSRTAPASPPAKGRVEPLAGSAGGSAETHQADPAGNAPNNRPIPSSSSRNTTVTAVELKPLAAPPPVPPSPPAAAPRAADPSATLPAVAAGSAAVLVRSIAYTKLPRGDRLTIELSNEAPFTSRILANPGLLSLTFSGVGVNGPVVGAAGTMRGRFINSVAMERHEGALAVNIRLSGQPRYSTFPIYDPYRLVIDLEEDFAPPANNAPAAVESLPRTGSPAASTTPVPVTAAETTPAVTKPDAPSSTSRGDYSLARQLGLGVSRIVIDPGHGGHDPGAQANGVGEADLVLDVALRLEKLLNQQPGFEVVLTRRTDRYVALEERTAIANRENADLFLSIHANSSPNKDTRGIETYFLNFATSASAEAVAARENAASGQSMHLLPELVKAIATSDKVAESREFANIVQASLMRRIGSLNKSIKDLGVKQAPFVVLIGARMPSVLAEISFLSNKSEAGLLQQANHRERIAQSLLEGILKYQASLKKVSAVAAR